MLHSQLNWSQKSLFLALNTPRTALRAVKGQGNPLEKSASTADTQTGYSPVRPDRSGTRFTRKGRRLWLSATYSMSQALPLLSSMMKNHLSIRSSAVLDLDLDPELDLDLDLDLDLNLDLNLDLELDPVD